MTPHRFRLLMFALLALVLASQTPTISAQTPQSGVAPSVARDRRLFDFD